MVALECGPTTGIVPSRSGSGARAIVGVADDEGSDHDVAQAAGTLAIVGPGENAVELLEEMLEQRLDQDSMRSTRRAVTVRSGEHARLGRFGPVTQGDVELVSMRGHARVSEGEIRVTVRQRTLRSGHRSTRADSQAGPSSVRRA